MDIVTYALAKSYCKKYLTLGSQYIGMLVSEDDIPVSSTNAGDYYLCDFNADVIGIGTIKKGNIIIWNGTSWDKTSFFNSSGLEEDVISNITVGASISGTTFPAGMSLTDYIKLVHISAVPPSISIVSVPSATSVYEKGDTQNLAISVDVTKTSNDIVLVTYSSNPMDLNFNGEKTITNPEHFIDTVNTTASDNASYTVTGVDMEGLTATHTMNVDFVYPIYVGILDPDTTDVTLDFEDIVNTGTKLLAKKGTRTITYNSLGEYAKFYFAYPSAYGLLSKVTDVANNIDITSGCSSSSRTTECLDGSTQTYTIVYPGVRTKYDNMQIKFAW